MIATVDLDDTLTETGKYYGQSINRFVEFMQSEYGLDPEMVKTRRKEIDVALTEEFGLNMQRFPQGLVIAYLDLVDNPTKEHREHIYGIGLNTFKSIEQYKQEGFMEGADEMLTLLNNHFDETHLVTAGDPLAQNPKIEALGLRDRLDEIHIVPHNGKETKLEEIASSSGVDNGDVVHIGNSATSDIQAALEAGCYGVYISEDMDWISSDEHHELALDHEAVRNYRTATEFIPDIPEISSKITAISPNKHPL